MFKNFSLTALRNIARHKGFSFFNIIGLSIGLTLTLLITLFIIDERSYDKQFADSDHIYRAYYEITKAEGNEIAATTPPTFHAALQTFPEVESASRMLYIKSPALFVSGDKRIYENSGAFVDSNFFEIFNVQFVDGSPGTALSSPTNIVISEEIAQRYFGSANVVGKRLEVDKDAYNISAVIAASDHSHLKLNYIFPLSASGLTAERLSNWGWYGFTNYCKLKPGADASALAEKFQPLVDASVNKEKGTVFNVRFQDLQDIHLHSSDFKYDLSQRGSIIYVKALFAIGLFILLIASFNFINLSTARSLKRAKEVGIKKTLGANRKYLVMQFMFESALLIVISTVLAVIIASCTLPLLNSFTGKSLSVSSLFSGKMILTIACLIIGVAVCAGLYPAIALSKFRPVAVLKGGHETGEANRSTPWVRNALVVIQFALSVMLIICSITVIRQVNYMQNKDLGFENDQVMLFSLRGQEMRNNAQTIKNEISTVSGVKSVSLGYGFPGDNYGDGEITIAGTNNKVKSVLLMGDADYIPTLNLHLVKGRNLNKDLQTDTDNGFIINETAVRAMGFTTPANALGKQLSWPTWRNQDSLKTGTVIGVVKDFHYKSVHDVIEPVVLMTYTPAASKMAVKLAGNNLENSIEQVRSIWNKFSPDYPLDFVFMDDTFQEMYAAENKLKTLLSVFTGFAVFVACLGLFGLAAYATERRRKEISIRKVLGAGSLRLASMLTFELTRLVCISLLIATPVAWQLMRNWLNDFSYRISFDVSIVLLAAVIAVVLAALTVGTQAVKAAMTTPIMNLKQD